MITYELHLTDQLGSLITLLEGPTRIEWARAVNDVGAFKVRFPREQFDRSLFGVDRRLQIWRKPEGGADQLIMVGFLRYIRRASQGDLRLVEIVGPDANELLMTRIVDADSGTAGSDKADTADDVMKAYVRENLGSSAVAARDLTAYGFTVQADLNLGPSVEKSASRRNLLLILQEIARDAAQQGTPVYFDVEHPTPTTYEFRTFVNQRGVDRSYPDGTNPVLLSEEAGTLVNPDFEQDYRDEITYVYAGGQGQGNLRSVVEIEDTARSGLSIFNRREGFFDGRNYETVARLTSAGRNRLHEGRPRQTFAGEIVDTEGNRFGEDWNFGDKVTALYAEEQLNVRVQAVMGSLDQQGYETLTGRLAYVE